MTIKIKGMSCNHCVMAVTKALSGIEGIKDIKVDLATGEATFVNEAAVDIKIIKDAVEKAGYDVA